MNHCKICGTENPETAQYCKECGRVLKREILLETIKFKKTTSKLPKIFKIAIWVFITAVLIFIVVLTRYINAKNTYNTYETNYRQIYQNDNFYNTPEGDILWDIIWDRMDLLIGFSVALGILNGALVLTSLFIFFKGYLRWKIFELNYPGSEVLEKLKKYVFASNKTEETIRIKESDAGELRLKDKRLGARGLFFLIEDEQGKAALIGEKYNTQNLIRTVFGKDINFIEK